MPLAPWNIDAGIADVTDMAVVIVAIVPDAIDLRDSAVATGSPAVENAGVAPPAPPFPDSDRKSCRNHANYPVDQHYGP